MCFISNLFSCISSINTTTSIFSNKEFSVLAVQELTNIIPFSFKFEISSQPSHRINLISKHLLTSQNHFFAQVANLQ